MSSSVIFISSSSSPLSLFCRFRRPPFRLQSGKLYNGSTAAVSYGIRAQKNPVIRTDHRDDFSEKTAVPPVFDVISHTLFRCCNAHQTHIPTTSGFFRIFRNADSRVFFRRLPQTALSVTMPLPALHISAYFSRSSPFIFSIVR